MNIHENARSTPASRALLVSRVLEQGWSVAQAALAAGLSRQTAYKWLKRHGQGGRQALRDRSSCAHRRPHALPADWARLVAYFRHFRQSARHIGLQLGIARSTVSACLARGKLGRLRALEPPRPANRYERRRPGELLHLDIKKLGRFWRPGHRVRGAFDARCRGAGWEFVHVAIDDHSRIAYAEILDDETGATCSAFLGRALAWFAQQGVKVRALLTDNGTGYRSHRFREACQHQSLRHQRTRPYTPQTNGKAERVIRTLMEMWHGKIIFMDRRDRQISLVRFVNFYNTVKPHASLDNATPYEKLMSYFRSTQTVNNP